MDQLEMTFGFTCTETDGDTEADVCRSFSSSGDIVPVLNNFLDFIRAAGFTWASQLIVVTDTGGEHRSNSL